MLRLAEIFQDKMMLQREKNVPVWGTADAGAMVKVSIQEVSGETRADTSGSWHMLLPPLRASYKEIMEICSETEKVVLENVAVGEIWVAAGQSNIEFPMCHEKYFSEEKKNMSKALLRFFDVPEISYEGQKEAFDYSNVGIWREADKAELARFSAVGYYFQKELAASLDVPVGIVGCNWGGTNCCVWMSRESAEKYGKPWVEEYKEKWRKLEAEEYWEKQNSIKFNDTGNPAMDAFSCFMLPRTPGEKEIKVFMENDSEGIVSLQELSPKEIPGNLYEHMVKTIAPFAVKGVLWYQGEGEDKLGQPQLYEGMLKALIKDWRKLWKDEALPFLIVQLPAWESWFGLENHGLKTVRYCQQKAAEETEAVWLCTNSDQGEQYDIHPKEKKTVGQRLALLARGKIYGEKILCEAPRAENICMTGKNRLEISFSNADGGLEIKGDSLSAMHILSGEEELEFSAKTENNKLILEVELTDSQPIKLIYACDKWFQVNLYNQAHLPALPFEMQLER